MFSDGHTPSYPTLYPVVADSGARITDFGRRIPDSCCRFGFGQPLEPGHRRRGALQPGTAFIRPQREAPLDRSLRATRGAGRVTDPLP